MGQLVLSACCMTWTFFVKLNAPPYEALLLPHYTEHFLYCYWLLCYLPSGRWFATFVPCGTSSGFFFRPLMWVISGRNVDLSIQSKMWYLGYFLLWLIDHSNLGQQSLWFSFHGQFFLVHWSSLNQAPTWQTVWNQAEGLLHHKLLWTKIPLRTEVFGVKPMTHLDLWYYKSAISSLWKVIQILSRFVFP